MDRRFVIVQISDLHLDGKGTRGSQANALHAAISSAMKAHMYCAVRILIINGDLLESPTNDAIEEAEKFIERMKESKEFTDVVLVPGNHDVKTMGLIGSRSSFYDHFQVTRTSESRYYALVGLDLVVVDSNKATFAKGAITPQTYDSMVRDSANLSARLGNELERQESENRSAGEAEIVRILALHHHPLPLADGEGTTVYGIPDEPLMYLVSPATFLSAAISHDVRLILHGHRHVHGISRYSVPAPFSTTSELEEYWRTIYVLSCPSSTGKDCDAGFNIIEFHERNIFGRQYYEFEVERFTRPKNAGAFSRLGPTPFIRLPLAGSFHRDIAYQIQLELGSIQPDRKILMEMARRLLVRRAFFNETESAWPFALYAYLATYVVWTNSLQEKIKQHASNYDYGVALSIGDIIWKLVELSGSALAMSLEEIDQLRYSGLSDQEAFLSKLRTSPAPNFNEAKALRDRRKLLQRLNASSDQLGLGIDFASGAPEESTF